MDLELLPPNGVGPLTVGMPRASAVQALESLRDPSAVSESDQPGRFIFRPSGLMVSTHCVRDQLEAIELGCPPSSEDAVWYRGINIFNLPAREVVSRMQRLTPVTADAGDPASFTAPDLFLGFWRPFEADDDPDDEQGYYFSSVLLARPGYDDTPAEAAARLHSAEKTQDR